MSNIKDRRPVVFLVTGVARAGKDTFAAALCEEMMRRGNRSEVFKFANVLKDALAVSLEFIGVGGKNVKPADIAFTEDDTIKPKVRDCLVALGKLARSVDSEIFARHLLTDLQGWIEFTHSDVRPVAIVADWRYANEHLVLTQHLDAHIVTVEIMRPGYGPANEEEEKSLKDLMFKISIDHTRLSTDPQGLRSIASELAHIYR